MRGGGDFGLCWLVLGRFLGLLLRLAFVRFRRGDGMLRLIGWRGRCSLSKLDHGMKCVETIGNVFHET